jgi:putative toxin-antitoxin system antitoxin component (TIGR02293 family)
MAIFAKPAAPKQAGSGSKASSAKTQPAPTKASSAGAAHAVHHPGFRQIYESPPVARIEVIRRGIPAKRVSALSREMDLTQESLIETLGLTRATLSRKAREDKPLSQDESERVLGVEALIGQVQAMIADSGDPAGFDAAKWVAKWLQAPLPALGGDKPASYMDTIEGQKLVASLLSMTQSGAYA